MEVIKRKKKLIGQKSTLDDTEILKTPENLKYSSFDEGMTVFGRISKVTDFFIIVSLPGRISGKVDITNISESYTNLLKDMANGKSLSNELKPVQDFYKEGDNLVCYIRELNASSRKASLSLEPNLINKNFNLNVLKKNSKIVVSVKGIEDHGYILETGIKNFKAFLPITELTTKQTNLYPGKQLICSITNIDVSENTYIVKVSLLSKLFDNIGSSGLPFNNLIPGVEYNLVIKNVLKNGLLVSFNNNNLGFVHFLYTENLLSSYQIGQKLIGTLLCFLPTSKFSYFTLLLQEKENEILPIGEVMPKAKVIKLDNAGVVVELNGQRGIIPLKHTNVDFEKINSVFTVNSHHDCKIIAFDWITRLYICSRKKSIMETEYVNTKKFKAGDKVDVIVKSINKSKGLITVSVAKSIGIVPRYHILDYGSDNKMAVGQKITARVLESSPKLVFTLKKSLIESPLPIISKFEDAQLNSVHDGTVIKISNKGVLISFFENLKGWIPKKFLNPQTLLQNWNLKLGQTVAIVIKSICNDKKKIILSLKSKKTSKTKVNIGDVVEGSVIDSSSDGVHVRFLNDEETIGFLPAGHMSLCHDVGKLLAAKTIAGHELTAFVFSTKPSLILSTTFAPKKCFNLKDLKVGDLVLCSVKKIHNDFVQVLLPVNKYSKYGKVFCNNMENVKFFHEYQILVGKVININKDTQEINLTTQLSKVWKSFVSDNLTMTSVDVLSTYLSKMSELSSNIYYTSKPISQFNLGQQVKGIVESITDSGIVLKLDNNVKGLVCTDHFSKSYKLGEEVTGTILWINYLNECVQITLLSHIINSVSVKQNKFEEIPIGTQLRGEIVLVNDWFILSVLKGPQKGTLVTLPARRHLNDIMPNLNLYSVGAQIKCYGILNKKDSNILLPICILKSAFETHNSNLIKYKCNESSELKLKHKMENSDDYQQKKKLKIEKC